MSTTEFARIAPNERAIVERHLASIPVKISEIARDLGVKLVASTLPAGVSGEIRPREGSFVVSVNRHDSPRRQRFTVAHEIAHFLLHRDQIGDGISDDVLYRSSLSDAREAEANRLAADILMPADIIRSSLAQRGGVATDELVANMAEEFGVSEVAMRIRLGLG